MTSLLSISGISSNIFFNQYYNINKFPLPLIIKPNIWKDIKNAYYGGRVEVY